MQACKTGLFRFYTQDLKEYVILQGNLKQVVIHRS